MHRRDLLKYSTLLLGGAVSSAVSRAVLAAAAPLDPGLARTIFDEGQQASVAMLSEMIIPATDTPGAIKAGVPDFIATVASEWYNDTERRIFFKGLQDLDQRCQAAEGVPFHLASEPARLAALQQQERITADYLREHPPKTGHPLARAPDDENLPFFGKLKELVVVGYYTSEVGATQELSYLPMPGHYDGDYDYARIGRRWTS